MIPNGNNITVTNQNKMTYIEKKVDFMLNKMILRQAEAFWEGMALVIDLSYLKLFTNEEMGRLLCGETKSFNVEDLYWNHISHGFEFNPRHLDEFWRVLRTFTDEEKDDFLQFVTGSPKPPFLGFEYMQPKFAINA